MARTWVKNLVEETSTGWAIDVVYDRHGHTKALNTKEVRELLEYMEYLEEQDALELLREQG